MDAAINDFLESDKPGFHFVHNSEIPAVVTDGACNTIIPNKLFCNWVKCPAQNCKQAGLFGPHHHCGQWLTNNSLANLHRPNPTSQPLHLHNWAGEEIWAHLLVTAIPCNRSGQTYRFMQFIDITDRVQQDVSSNKTDKKLRILFEGMNEAFALHEIITNDNNEPVDYRYLDVNPAFEKMTGFTYTQIVGHRVLELMPQTEPFWIKEFGRVAIEGGTAILVNFARELDRYYEVKVFSPEPRHFAVIFSDITQRIQTEQALKESEAHHRFLTENILDVIWIYDIESARFTYVSPSIQKLRGYTPEEVMAQSLFETFPPSSLQIVKEALPLEIEKFKSGRAEVFKRELEQYCKDGSVVWIDIIAYLRQNNNTGHIEIIGTSRNITDRHQAEAARQEMEQRYRILTEVTNEGIIIHQNGIVAEVNPSLLRMMGLPDNPALMKGKSIFSILPKDEIELVRNRISGNNLDAYQLNLHRLDGTTFPAEVLAKEIEINGNRFRVASVNDITQRKNAEKQLVESEARFRSIFDNAVAGIAFVGINSKLLMINKAYCEIVGYGHDELEGKSFYDITHPDDIAKEKILIAEAIATGTDHFRFEKRYINKQHKTVWAELSVSILRTATGEPHSMVAVANDISLKKQNEQELLQTLEYNKRINMTSPVGIVTTDANGEIIYANKLAISILGLSGSDIIGKKYNAPSWRVTTLDGNTFNHSELPFARVKMELKPVYNLRHAIEWPNGKRVYLSVNASPLFSNNGAFAGMVATLEDISDKLEVEKQLQQSNVLLHEMNRTKDRFFSIIAHDLRGSLGNITNLSELLYLGLNTTEIQIDEGIVKTIYDSSLKTLNLLENLLAWANSQRHSVAVNPENFNLSQALRDSVMVSEAIAVEKQITLAFKLDDTIDIRTDRAMLSTIVRNLVSNAIKYSYESSEVTISSNRTGDGRCVEICVLDHGIGMNDATLDGLFKMDGNTSVHGTAGEEGTGLGLVLCKEFIGKLGGTVNVESEPGKGSCFCVKLPLK